jgi:hypothetical protein
LFLNYFLERDLENAAASELGVSGARSDGE